MLEDTNSLDAAQLILNDFIQIKITLERHYVLLFSGPANLSATIGKELAMCDALRFGVWISSWEFIYCLKWIKFQLFEKRCNWNTINIAVTGHFLQKFW